MEGTSVGDLQRAFASAEVPTNGNSGHCGLCDCSLDGDDAIVEVALSPDSDSNSNADAPDSLLCSRCYEHVVGDVGLTPVRVFKSGPRRQVVFPGPDD